MKTLHYLRFCLPLLCAGLLFTSSPAVAQADYRQKADAAFATYEEGKYEESGKQYEVAFKNGKPTATDYYNAACTWALAGNKDKAFLYLDKAVDTGWSNKPHFTTDRDLSSLHSDTRWQPLVSKLSANLEKLEANYNKPLKNELEAIYATDQGVRMKIDSVQKNYGMKSPEWNNLMKEMKAVDEHNTRRVTEIIDQYGFPGKSLVGGTASQAAFLVIQHSDLAIQEKYFPILKAAADKGELSKSALALLQDRILTGNNKPQIYGSQLRQNPETQKMEFFPIEDEANVDKRRAEIGMEPLAAYAKRFGLDYKVPAASAKKTKGSKK